MSLRQRSFFEQRPAVGAIAFVLVLQELLWGCGQTIEVGLDDALSGAGNAGAGGALPVAGSSGSGGAGAEGGAPACVQTSCRGVPYLCGNCLDDDEDGAVDGLDPDCLGPCDDDESALSTGLMTAQATACRQDCYFDGDNGPGNDKCEWNHACDRLSLAPDYPPSGEARCEYVPGGQAMGVDCAALEAAQLPACLDACLPVVPNGCDCFGCCELPGGSENFRFIGLGRGTEGCSLDRIDDETCPPCTPVGSCMNACEQCEVCVGRPAPAGCEPNSGCPVGQAACSPDAPCNFGHYCVTGCCVRAPEPT